MRFTGCGKRGWDKTRLHLERGRHSFLWSSDELSKPTCKEFGAQNFKQIEIFLSPSLSVSNCPGDLTESCYTRCDFRSVVSGFNNVFIFIAVIFGCPGTVQSSRQQPALSAGSDARTGGTQRWRCQHGASGTHPGPALSSHGSPVRNAWLSHPFKQDPLRAPHPEHLPKVGLHRNRQDTGERVGGGKELLRHVKCMSKWGSSGSKLNKPSLGQPQRLQLTGNPSGEVQVLGRKKKSTKFPHPSFSPFLVTIFKAWSYRGMPQWRHGRREGRKDFHRSSLFHYIFYIF